GWDVSVELPHDGPALAELERVTGLSVYHSRRARLPRNLWELATYLARAPIDLVRLALYVRKGRYECVWVNSLFNPLAAIAARLAGARVVWHLHERNLKGVAGRAMAVVIDLCANEAVVISDFVARSFPLRRAQVRLLP